MSPMSGTVVNGHVVLDQPADLPEGTRVEVLPVEAGTPTIGMREEDWPTTPEGIAALVKRMEEAEPLEMTSEELADWEDWRRKTKAYELANWEERCRRIEEGFE